MVGVQLFHVTAAEAFHEAAKARRGTISHERKTKTSAFLLTLGVLKLYRAHDFSVLGRGEGVVVQIF